MWGEHVKQPGPDAAAIAAHMQARGVPLSGLTVHSRDYGFIASNRPFPAE